MKSTRIGSMVSAVLAILFTWLFVPRVAASGLVNGSFEDPATTYYSSTATGWNLTEYNHVFSNNAGLGLTAYGTQYALIKRGTSVAQTMTGFQPGATYSLSFGFADETGGAGPTLYVGVLAGEGITYQQVYTAPAGGPYGANGVFPFTSAYELFVAPANGTAIVTFFNESVGPSTDLALDNVSLALSNLPAPPFRSQRLSPN